MADHQSIVMVTLGRPFHLGMLYDIRTDKIITGTTLWDPQNLANNTITHKQPYTAFEIITDDSLQTKAHALGVQASLKLSLLGGLISISGSAKYAEDYQKTNTEARLTLKYSTTTHFEQLTMKHLGKGNLNHPDLHDADLATHVVTGVVYGAEAFFIFDRTISTTESKKEISGTLKVMIEKIPQFKIKADAKLNLTDKEDNFVDKLNCKFYGDFLLNENPSSFSEAVHIYRRLPSLLGENNENVVPKKVWLYPLHLLDNKAMRIVRVISSNLIDYCTTVIEKLRSSEVRTLDLLKADIIIHSNHLRKQLLDFVARLSEFQRDLKEKIALYLPKLRGNTGVEESVLSNFFKQVDSSPFNQQKLDSWLEEKQKEISLITTWVDNFIKDKSLHVMIGSPYNAIGNVEYDYVFCLSLRFFEENDPHLIEMYNYRYNISNFNSSGNSKNHTKWFENRNLIGRIRKNVREFTEFAKANNDINTKIKFIVHEEYSINQIKNTELTLYDNGMENKNFIIPSKPSIPYAKFVTDTSIKIGWEDTMNESETIKQYKIMYQKSIDKTVVQYNENQTEVEKWIEIYTNGKNMEVTISDLSPATIFTFKVQSVTAIGLSPISDVSEPIKTLLAEKPKTSLALKQTPDDVMVLQRQNAQITFEIDDSSRFNITWLFNGNPLELSDKYTMQTKFQIILNVNNTNLTDSGTYTAIIESGKNKLVIPVNMTVRIPMPKKLIDIHPKATWTQDGITVAGGNGRGNKSNQLFHPRDMYIDNNMTIYVADELNHRIMEWKLGATNGRVVTDGNGVRNQFSDPWDVIIDEQENSLLSCSLKGQKVTRWPLQQNTNKGETIISDVGCTSLELDERGFLYVVNGGKHEVRRYKIGSSDWKVIAGGNGEGSGFDQFSLPTYVFVDQDHSIYVSDHKNDRVMKWEEGAKRGHVVAGGNGKGNGLTQLNGPRAVIVDKLSTVYVVDQWNHRVMRWPKGSVQGSVIAGGNGYGGKSNQLCYPVGLSFNRFGDLYVTDKDNNRVQKYSIKHIKNK